MSATLRPPDALREPARGEPVALRVARAPGLRGYRRRLPADTTLAEAAHQLIGTLVPLRCSADGRLLGWYRLGTAQGLMSAEITVGSLDEEETLFLHFVENRVHWLRVEAEGHVWRAPVGDAVPAASVVDALALQLALGDGPWELLLDGAPLDDFHILADRTLTPASTLLLRRPGSA